MTPARGDTRPCVKAGCDGLMQFGREPLALPNDGRSSGAPGWVCSGNPAHFTRTIAES